MIKLYFNIGRAFIGFFLLQYLPYNPSTASELSEEDIHTSTSFLRMVALGKESPVTGWSLENTVTDEEKNVTAGMWKNDKKKRVVIAYHGIKTLFDRESDLVEISSDYDLTGKINNNTLIAERNLHKKLDGSLNHSTHEYEYIFTGYGSGGPVAILAAARLLLTLHLTEDKLKIVNFSSSKLGDDTLVNDLYSRIPLQNILHFNRHLDLDFNTYLKHAGISIELTPMEGVFDTFSYPFMKLPRRAAEIGALSAGVFTIYSYFPHINKFSFFKVFSHHYNSSVFGRQLVKGTIGLTLSLIGIYDFIKVTDIPSQWVITRAWSYTQTRLKAGTELTEAGKIWPIFGSRT